jgi:hypothetical protein
MGARPEEYALVAPYRSYIHVEEFESPKELTAYLSRLDNDDDLYNSYFRWKGTGEFIINTNFSAACALCCMMTSPTKFTRTLMIGGADRESAQEDRGGMWTKS